MSCVGGHNLRHDPRHSLARPLLRPLVTAAAWEPFTLAAATVAETRELTGRVVRSTFRVVNPPDYSAEVMAIGDVARSAVVPTDHRINAGDTVTVEGVLRVIEHPAAVVNGERVPGWVEVRVAEGRVIPHAN